jgi:hypothetical protein
MTDIQTPAALLSYGPREAKDGWRYEVILGTVIDPDAVTAPLPAPVGGMEPLVRARFDLAGLTPAIEIAKSFGANDPKAQEGLAKLQEYGVGGDGAVKISYQAGRTKTDSVSYTVIEGAKKMADAWGLGTRTLSKEDFGAIPSDATTVFFRKSADKPIFDVADIVKENPEAQQGFDKFQEVTGVNLQTDVLDSLGGGAAVYLSDSTGGGGMGSAVVLLGLRDKAKFRHRDEQARRDRQHAGGQTAPRPRIRATGQHQRRQQRSHDTPIPGVACAGRTDVCHDREVARASDDSAGGAGRVAAGLGQGR